MKNLSYVEIAKKIKEEDIMIGKYFIVGEIDDALPVGEDAPKNRDQILEHLCDVAYETYINSDYYNVATVARAMTELIDTKYAYGEHVLKQNPDITLMEISLEELEEALDNGYGTDC